MAEHKIGELEKQLNEYKNLTAQMQTELSDLKQQFVESKSTTSNQPKENVITINTTAITTNTPSATKKEEFLRLNGKRKAFVNLSEIEKRNLTYEIFNSWLVFFLI